MSKIVNKTIEVTKRYFFIMALMGMVVGFSAFKFVPRDTVEFGEHHYIDEENQPAIEYIDVTNLEEFEDYNCVSTSGNCIVYFNEEDLDENGRPLPDAEPAGVAKPGVFTPVTP